MGPFSLQGRLCRTVFHLLQRSSSTSQIHPVLGEERPWSAKIFPRHYGDDELVKSLSDHEITRVRSLFEGLVGRVRHCLAQSITLVESSHPRKRLQAQLLLSLVLEHQKSLEAEKGPDATSFRIGLSGPPGAGKSTFLENMGKRLTGKGHRVAVLAIDPSSSTTGGSLLGDKTRMPELSCDMNAFIRPSPTGCHVGGATRSTSEAIVMCEGAGFDTVFVETVGVGQSEYEVADMVDLFVLLIPPAGGDELQGLKRGIVERSHLVVINKSDGDLKPAAIRIASEYTSALKFMRPIAKSWRPVVKRVSSISGEGMEELWSSMQDFRKIMSSSGELQETRIRQQKAWMWRHVNTHIMDVFRNHPAVKKKVLSFELLVEEGKITPGYAADLLLREFLK